MISNGRINEPGTRRNIIFGVINTDRWTIGRCRSRILFDFNCFSNDCLVIFLFLLLLLLLLLSISSISSIENIFAPRDIIFTAVLAREEAI